MMSRLIITAASRGFGPSLLALLGSLNLNWPGHPPIRVYDIGLDDDTLEVLQAAHLEVIKVPPFCPHWRQHYTWKIWCWNEAPATQVLWIDAGVAVLQPLDEVFSAIEHLGYFVVPSYCLLEDNASEAACRGCGVEADFCRGKVTLAATLIGFSKTGLVGDVLQEALAVASTEEHIAATEPLHRHDQAIISLLLYKHLAPLVMADGIVYCGDGPPRQEAGQRIWIDLRHPNPQAIGQTPGQKVWVHRRQMAPQDIDHLASGLFSTGQPYLPRDPHLVRKAPTTCWRWVRRQLGRVKHRLLHGPVPRKPELSYIPQNSGWRIHDGTKD